MMNTSILLGLKALPIHFRRLLVGVGVFGAGDFSHSLLILYASRMLAPVHGLKHAASLAVGLYTLRNVFYAGSAYLSGWLSDHIASRKSVLAAGYTLAGVTAMLLSTGTHSLALLVVIFILAGLYIGTEEALEDSLSPNSCPRSSTAWPSVLSPRSMRSAISSRAFWWALSGAFSTCKPPSPPPRFSSSPGPS